MTRCVTVGILLLLGACGSRQPESDTPSPARAVGPALTAQMVDTAGKTAGTASILESRSGPLLVLKLKRVPPGTHGLHVHANGVCTPPTFESAGPHLNPAGRKHGAENPAGPHAGDLPNVHARGDSSIDTTFTLPRSLLDQSALGPGSSPRTLVLHAKADDLMTDPSGDSGARILCGTLMR